MKPVLLYNAQDYATFTLPWIQQLVLPWIELEQYQPGRCYDPAQYSVLVPYNQKNQWHSVPQASGLRVVIDHLWDSDVALVSTVGVDQPPPLMHGFNLRCANSQWYIASREFAHYGYNQYRPQRQRDRSFLLLMNLLRPHRTRTLQVLQPVLDSALYSYVSQKIEIAGDSVTSHPVAWQRFMNPQWYDRTAFSVVSESSMRCFTETGHYFFMRTEVSEKLFKPLAYFHPFVVTGSVDTLTYLHSQGFVTYDNLFDQSYDSVESDQLRLDLALKQVITAVDHWQRDQSWAQDPETQQRAEHNHHRFFDQQLIGQRWKQEVIDPVLEYVS